MKLRLIFVCALPVLLFSTGVFAQEDKEGASDHPQIPRVSGTNIVGYAQSDYDEGVFMIGTQERKLMHANVEGKLTRIMYFGPEGLSTLAILRNYQQAFADLGEVQEIYSCKKKTCFSNLGAIFIWDEGRLTPMALT